MKLYPIYAALSLCYEVYGVELDEDAFEVYAMSAYHKIGNRISKMKILRADTTPDKDGGWFICVPDDCEAVEAVTLPFEDAQMTSNIRNGADWRNLAIEDSIESTKWMPNEHYIPGKYVKYKEIGNKLYFTEPFHNLSILYKGSYLDDEGFPFLTEKEVEAIAVYCAYCYFYKKGLSQKDNGTIQMALMLNTQWQKACASARIPKDISQNEMNEILDVMTSHNRHMYGRTTKPIN